MTDRAIKEVEFGIWDNHKEDLLHDFGCHSSLIPVFEELARMNITEDAVEFTRYKVVIFAVHNDRGDDEVINMSDFTVDPGYLRFLEGKK